MRPPPRTLEAGTPPREPAPTQKCAELIKAIFTAFRKQNWEGSRKILRIVIPELPGLAWLSLNVVYQLIKNAPAIFKVSRSLREIERADEKRRRERRWKP